MEARLRVTCAPQRPRRRGRSPRSTQKRLVPPR